MHWRLQRPGRGRVLCSPRPVVLNMDFYPPVTGTYPTDPGLPLLTLDEAREAARLLLHFADSSADGQAAGDLGQRLPAD
jgi:hypothetical protein